MLKKEYVTKIVVMCIFCAFSVMVVLGAANKLPSFDGAMNLQVPRNVVEVGEYATSYNEYKEFDHRIQSGSPLLLPIALMFFLFGKSVFTAQSINAAYLILCSVIIYFLTSRLTNKLFGIIALLIFIQIPRLFTFGGNIYGEIPALFYLLAALFAFLKLEDNPNTKGLPLLTGGLFGLAYLTKTVALIAGPSIVLFILIDILVIKKVPLKAYLLCIVGFIIPVASFELYKLMELGFRDYVIWWKHETSSIFMQAGVKSGYQDTPGFIDKGQTHLAILSKEFKMPLVFLVSFILVPQIILAAQGIRLLVNKQYEKIKLSAYILTGTAFTYLLWWIFITPTAKAWSRRIINGFIIQEIVLIIALFVVISGLRYKDKLTMNFIKEKDVKRMVLLAISILLSCILVIQPVKNYSKLRFLTEPTADLKNAQKIANAIKKLPSNAVVFGSGWWQSPKLSFLSGRRFYDIRKYDFKKISNNKKHIYFTIGPEAYFLAKDQMSFLKSPRHTLILREGNYFLYRLDTSTFSAF